jgi:hypothetical protein
MDRRIEPTPRFFWGIGTVILLAVGSLGPWATLGALSVSGTSNGRDGTLTLVLAIAAAILVCVGRFAPVVTLIASGALAVGIIDTNNVSNTSSGLFEVSVGWGLVLVDVAAASLLIWSLAAFRARRRQRQALA